MNGGLWGKHIVNTRATHQASDFDTLIQARGAVPLSYPCIAIQPPEDTTALDTALKHLATGEFDWLVLTSANTVLSLAQRLQALGLSFSVNSPFKTAVIGASTAETVKTQLGLQVDLMPDEYIAEALAKTILNKTGQRIFLPESAIARPTLKTELKASGVDVYAVTAYETVRGSGGIDLSDHLRRNQVDVVAFTSSSIVHHFVDRLHDEVGEMASLDDVCIACIGPKTAATAKEKGFSRIIVPDKYTLEGMLNIMEDHFMAESRLR